MEWVALGTAGGTAPVGWRGPHPLTPNCPCPAVSCDPRDEQLWPRARPWAVSLVSQISSPGKGQKGRRKGREAIKRRKCWVGSGAPVCYTSLTVLQINGERSHLFTSHHFAFTIKPHFKFKFSQNQLPANLRHSPYDLFWIICFCNMLCASFGTMGIHK